MHFEKPRMLSKPIFVHIQNHFKSNSPDPDAIFSVAEIRHRPNWVTGALTAGPRVLIITPPGPGGG